jgi:type IV pilus assembly protein PilV
MAVAKNKGFSLIELLVALFVVALGLLGHARLQISTMKEAQVARYAQIANDSVLELSERIQAEPDSAINGYFDVTTLSSGSSISDVYTILSCLDSNVSCSDQQFARYELNDWFTEVESSLPLPRISIVTDGNLVTIDLVWDARNSGSGATSCTDGDDTHECIEVAEWIR